MFLALREIKKEKLRFLMIIMVTALIAYLVYFLASLAFGLAQLNRTAVDHLDAQGIVLSKASNENIYASQIDESLLKEVGLELRDGINVSNTTVYINNETQANPLDLVFIGYDLDNPKMSAKIIEGRGITSSSEIALSNNFKDTQSVEIGDVITSAKTGREFTLVGFTENSNFNTVPVAYVSQEMATQAMMMYTVGDKEIDAIASPTPNMPNRVSAIVTYETIDEARLNEYDLIYLNMDEFINAIPGYQAQVLTFGFMILALALISSIIIGIFMYILTMQKRPVFGVLKIQGYRNGYIMRSVIYQSMIVVLSGFAVGLALTIITIILLPAKVPVQLFWPLNIGTTLFAFMTSMIGTIFSARNILKIDPLEAL